MNTDFPNAKNATHSLSAPYSYSLFTGANYNQNLAAEIAYTSLGTADLGGFVNLKGSAYSLSAIGKFPINDSFDLIGKLGIAKTDVYFETAGSVGGTETLFAPTLGAGVQFNSDGAESKSLSLHLLGRAQGIAVISHVYRDEKLLRHETKQLNDWIRQI